MFLSSIYFFTFLYFFASLKYLWQSSCRVSFYVLKI